MTLAMLAFGVSLVVPTASGQGVPRPQVIHSSGNPILSDGSYYSADPAPMVAGDTLYILAGRDEAAPDLLGAFTGDGSNDGPPSIAVPQITPTAPQIDRSAARAPNGMQKGLGTAAMLLPTAAADVGAHIERLANIPDPFPGHATVGAAAADIAAHVKAFLGGL